MDRQCLIVVFSVFLAFLPQGLLASTNDAVPARWTVREATSHALRHNPDGAIALERIKIADADIRAAKAAFFPQLTVSAEYGRTNNPMYSFGNILNQGMFTETIDFNDPGTTDTLQTRATVQYRLYSGGHDRAALEAAGERSRVAEHEQAAIRNRLEFEVVRAFCTIVQATETIGARQSALEAIEASLAVARARFEEGNLLHEDVLNLEVQQSRAAEQLILARHGLSLAQRGFLHLLGLTGDSVAIETTDNLGQEIPAERDSSRRPELAAITATIKAQESLVRQAEAGYLPTADAFGSYQVDKGFELSDGSGNSWSAGIRLSYTLFDGQQTGAATQRAEAQVRAAREQQRKMELAFRFEMEQAALALRQEEERLKVTDKMVASATESTRLARLRFKEGVLLVSELIDTENRLTEARMSHTLAAAARRIAIADLRRAVGLRQFTQGD